MPQLDAALVRDRARRLRDAGEAAFTAHLAAAVGAEREVLVERGDTGHTEHFTPVAIAGEAPGSIVRARITGRTGRALVAAAMARAA